MNIENLNPDITCTSCGSAVNWLAIFPGDKCVDCHARGFKMGTADDLTAMWRAL